MKKNVFGRKFKRDINKRKALFKGLLSSLVLNERIKTTEAKAKAIKAEADKLISKARKEKKLAKKLLSVHLHPKAIEKLISEITPRFKDRNGGYVRIIKLGERLSDNARMAVIEWVEKREIVKPEIDELGEEKIIKKEDKKKKTKEKTKKEKIVKKQVEVKKQKPVKTNQSKSKKTK